MNTIEQILHQSLQADPANWEIRFELLEKMIARDAHAEALQVITDAPQPPASEKELRKLTEVCVQAKQPAAAEPLLSAFVAGKPASALGHYLLAKLLSKTGDLMKAREHYTTAVALNADLEDEILAAKLADFGQTMVHDAKQADQVIEELKTPVAAPVPPAVPVAVEPEPVAMEQEPAVVEPEPEPVEEPAAAEPVAVAPISPPSTLATPIPDELIDPAQTGEAAEDVSELDQIPAIEADVAPPTHATALVPPIGEANALAGYTVPVEAHAHVVEADGQEMIEFDAGEELTRHIILGEPAAEKIEAAEREKGTARGISGIAIAVLVHIALAMLLATFHLFAPSPKPPTIVSNGPAVLDDNVTQQQEIQKQVQRKPVQSAQALTEVVSVSGLSQVALPDVKTDTISFEPIGMGDTFGSSMTFDAGEDGGMVSFFGSRSTSKKVVFAVDYSASMKSMDKHVLMRKELAKSLQALPNGISYQCIFFAGPAWYHGDEVKGNNKTFVIKAQKGGKEYPWTQISGAMNYQPDFAKKDRADLQKMDLISSSRSNIRKSVEQVQETKLVYGTDWRWPLYMAMNLEPDTIFFMTDGAYGGKQEILDEIIDYNNKHGRAKINTICMMVPQAMEKLQFLAEKSRGECSLVLKDQTVLRGKELEDYLKKGNGKKK